MITRALAVPAVLLAFTAFAAPAFAQSNANDILVRGYTQACHTTATQIPPPGGDADIKNNSSFDAYCSCYGEKMAAQATELARTPPASRPQGTQFLAQQFALRNACRAQTGLPTVKSPF